jgi:hypothetical protein
MEKMRFLVALCCSLAVGACHAELETYDGAEFIEEIPEDVQGEIQQEPIQSLDDETIEAIEGCEGEIYSPQFLFEDEGEIDGGVPRVSPETPQLYSCGIYNGYVWCSVSHWSAFRPAGQTAASWCNVDYYSNALSCHKIRGVWFCGGCSVAVS